VTDAQELTTEADELREQLTRLLALGTSTVYEGSGLDCWVDPRLRPVWTSARLAGPAFTVQTVPGDNLAVQRASREAPEGSVLVADCGGGEFGHWGGILTEIALVRGLAGLVIDGSVRDIDEIERLGFPIFSSGIAMRHAAKVDPGVVGEPISLAGREVRTGDIVLADTDGVIVIPLEKLDQAMDGALRRAEMEQERLAIIRSGVIPPMKVEGAP
jgi:4-hydroxy-4-methyl-2-oxoglutarate aldolase